MENPYRAPTEGEAQPQAQAGLTDGPAGLRGWLILVGITVVSSPITAVMNFVTYYLPVFSDGTWERLTTPGSDNYNPNWTALIYVEGAYRLCIIAVALWLLYLFFTKDHRFPAVFIGLMLSARAVYAIDSLVTGLLIPEVAVFEGVTLWGVGKAIAVSLLWLAYMLRSKRVKATFVNGRAAQL